MQISSDTGKYKLKFKMNVSNQNKNDYFFCRRNPTPNNDPVEVKPIQNNVTNYVDITNNGFIPSVNPHAEFIQFWDQFLDKHKDLLGNCSQNL